MDRDVINQMRAEEANLSRKLKAVRDLLAAYGEDVGTPTYNVPASIFTNSVPARTGATVGREKVGIEGFGKYGRVIVATSMQAMLMSLDPVKTREIVDFLEAMKIQITGENKVNAVGALLSRSADIISHGKGGWSVADDARAREVVGEYAHKENEAPSETADASDAASEGEPPPKPASSDPSAWARA